jgi:hypothetical protein
MSTVLRRGKAIAASGDRPAVAEVQRQVVERNLFVVDRDADEARQLGVGKPVLESEAHATGHVLEAAKGV